MNTSFRALASAVLVLALFGVALAKLPPPPPLTDEQKAAAEAKKAKDAATAEATKQAQARAEDRVVQRYIAEQKAKGVTVTPQMGPSAAPAHANVANTVSAPPKDGAAPSK